MGAKDFGAIESDYAFFMAHATESASDAAAYAHALAGFARGRSGVRLLDFGCGAGDFTERLLQALAWPPEALEIALVEPVAPQRHAAARRLAAFSRRPIADLDRLTDAPPARFDVVISNHVLYYVDDLDDTLRQLLARIAPGGRMLLALAGWDNPLLDFWRLGFAQLDRPVPYYTAEDVAAALTREGSPFARSTVAYELRFPDTAENRLKMLRFLLGEHLAEIGPQRLLGEFDRFVRGGEIVVETGSWHFGVEGDSRMSVRDHGTL